jgi:hypothetical protein
LHEHAPRLDRIGDEALLAVVLLHRDRRLREEPVDLAGLERPHEGLVVVVLVVNEWRGVFHRFGHVRHRRKRLVVNLDELGRVLGERATLRHDDRNAVTRIARLVGCERAVLRNVTVTCHRPGAGQRPRPFLGEVGAREGRHDPVGRERL